MSEAAWPQSRQAVAAELKRRLLEPPPSRVQVLTGPRQVGKTTLLLELARTLPNALYHAVDTPEAALPGWWEVACSNSAGVIRISSPWSCVRENAPATR